MPVIRKLSDAMVLMQVLNMGFMFFSSSYVTLLLALTKTRRK
jgi:hypothetical protein